jgi:hypothetical protein
MSFLAYVNTCRDGIDPQGDFVRDAREDPHLPDAKTWRELESYLWETHAGDPAIRGAQKVWLDYMADRRGESDSS